jgi:2-C-methyl-D-erythritol 2,4-cyclodiphosphate synthase
MNIGFGYDSHALVGGRPLVIGGVRIPFTKGLKGHSDGDVLTHAVMDALLGAAGLPDIGIIFPAKNQKYKNISSLLLLKKVKKRLGWRRLVNLDSVIICDRPPLNKFLLKMKKNIAGILNVSVSQISIKAKHAEGLAILRDKAILAGCVCLLQ